MSLRIDKHYENKAMSSTPIASRTFTKRREEIADMFPMSQFIEHYNFVL